jgi:predicted GNAT family acetyltransferase
VNVEVHDAPDRHEYEALADGHPAGRLVYRESPNGRILVHTEVDPAFEGHGVGGAMARYALESARERKVPVVVECPFVAGWLDHHPEYASVAQRA